MQSASIPAAVSARPVSHSPSDATAPQKPPAAGGPAVALRGLSATEHPLWRYAGTPYTAAFRPKSARPFPDSTMCYGKPSAHARRTGRAPASTVSEILAESGAGTPFGHRASSMAIAAMPSEQSRLAFQEHWHVINQQLEAHDLTFSSRHAKVISDDEAVFIPPDIARCRRVARLMLAAVGALDRIAAMPLELHTEEHRAAIGKAVAVLAASNDDRLEVVPLLRRLEQLDDSNPRQRNASSPRTASPEKNPAGASDRQHRPPYIRPILASQPFGIYTELDRHVPRARQTQASKTQSSSPPSSSAARDPATGKLPAVAAGLRRTASIATQTTMQTGTPSPATPKAGVVVAAVPESGLAARRRTALSLASPSPSSPGKKPPPPPGAVLATSPASTPSSVTISGPAMSPLSPLSDLSQAWPLSNPASPPSFGRRSNEKRTPAQRQFISSLRNGSPPGDAGKPGWRTVGRASLAHAGKLQMSGLLSPESGKDRVERLFASQDQQKMPSLLDGVVDKLQHFMKMKSGEPASSETAAQKVLAGSAIARMTRLKKKMAEHAGDTTYGIKYRKQASAEIVRADNLLLNLMYGKLAGRERRHAEALRSRQGHLPSGRVGLERGAQDMSTGSSSDLSTGSSIGGSLDISPDAVPTKMPKLSISLASSPPPAPKGASSGAAPRHSTPEADSTGDSTPSSSGSETVSYDGEASVSEQDGGSDSGNSSDPGRMPGSTQALTAAKTIVETATAARGKLPPGFVELKSILKRRPTTRQYLAEIRSSVADRHPRRKIPQSVGTPLDDRFVVETEDEPVSGPDGMQAETYGETDARTLRGIADMVAAYQKSRDDGDISPPPQFYRPALRNVYAPEPAQTALHVVFRDVADPRQG